jgi:hypothetical protein
LDDYRALFREPARKLLAARAIEPQEDAVASLAALGVSVVVGCAFQELLDPGWFTRERPLAEIGWLAERSSGTTVGGEAAARPDDA